MVPPAGARLGLKVIEVPLTDKEKKELEVSASHVAELVAALDKVLAG